MPSHVVEQISESNALVHSPFSVLNPTIASTLPYCSTATSARYRIRVRAKVTDVRIHDLRRTLGSWLKASGADLATIGRVLNHADPASTAVYARLDTEAIRPALEANARLMRLGVRRKLAPSVVSTI